MSRASSQDEIQGRAMPDTTLFTLLHISDLHFGTLPQGENGDPLSAEMPPFLARFPHLEGLLGHHRRGLAELHSFAKKLWTDVEDVHVAITGDLTATGAVNQFTLADQYLGDPSGGPLGFGLGLDWRSLAISGNHDHWPGSPVILGNPTAGLAAAFPTPFPRVCDPIDLGGGRSIRVILINSDADVAPFSLRRLKAQGSFISELETLVDALPEPDDGEIRVLLTHHSIARADAGVQDIALPFPDAKPGLLDIDQPSVAALQNFLVDARIRIVLSGHLHVPRLTRFEASNGKETLSVLEARCGSTTQLDAYRPKLVAQLKRKRLPAPNSLILHRLIDRDGMLLWTSEVYWRASGRGFTNASRTTASAYPHWMDIAFDVS